MDEEGPVLFYERRFYAFSNFSSFAVDWRGRVWMTSEHAFQAAKFLDPELQDRVAEARSAHDAKKVARALEVERRLDWETVRLGVMEEILRAKLAQHPYVEKKLRETGTREIVEDSLTDAFWGWGPDRKGLNHLGKLWMKLRSELV